ncbi:helix-turn-helix domain-containing protein [Sphingomonas sp. SUN019]|uniref:helix-turn-helix domain-containing protein n=1 Tax=Sphingomonas sp. SUN019 TaxID=2937788 RepID=UPI0021640163|nr:helix-turn-helix transcriptional regulator [Sphingomonas sp. SUN019]UVO52400.1 helix-turn-helix domain-containing protein [Sphingomonas sp. SUN019]
MLAERFGREVRARRKACGMTQTQLADGASMSEEWVRRIERGVGAPSFDAIEALASALGSSVGDLFKPMSSREGRALRIDRMLNGLSEAELMWIESLIRAALARPTS